MKTSIFNMTFTLPPMVEITQVEKDMPFVKTLATLEPCNLVWNC